MDSLVAPGGILRFSRIVPATQGSDEPKLRQGESNPEHFLKDPLGPGGMLRFSRITNSNSQDEQASEDGSKKTADLFNDPLGPGGMLRMSRILPSQRHDERQHSDAPRPSPAGLAEIREEDGPAVASGKPEEWSKKVSMLQSLVGRTGPGTIRSRSDSRGSHTQVSSTWDAGTRPDD